MTKPIMPDRISVLGVMIDNLTLNEAVARIIAFALTRSFHFVVAPNAHHIKLLRQDEVFADAYRHADLVISDGKPIVALSRLLGTPLKARVAGADLMMPLLAAAEKDGQSIFIVKGGQASRLDDIVSRIAARFPKLKIAGSAALPYDFDFARDTTVNERTVHAIRDVSPAILFVSLGAPKEEAWVLYNRERLASVGACLAIGAALDSATGVVARAPLWMQRAGLEWLFRLAQEPGRLWKRYLVGNALFLGLAAVTLFGRLGRSILGRFGIKGDGKK